MYASTQSMAFCGTIRYRRNRPMRIVTMTWAEPTVDVCGGRVVDVVIRGGYFVSGERMSVLGQDASGGLRGEDMANECGNVFFCLNVVVVRECSWCVHCPSNICRRKQGDFNLDWMRLSRWDDAAPVSQGLSKRLLCLRTVHVGHLLNLRRKNCQTSALRTICKTMFVNVLKSHLSVVRMSISQLCLVERFLSLRCRRHPLHPFYLLPLFQQFFSFCSLTEKNLARF